MSPAKSRNRRWLAWVLLAVWAVGIVVALTVPIDYAPKVMGRGFDKVAHTAMFTVLGVLAQAAAPWYSLLFTLPFGAGLEYLQKKLPYRTFDQVEVLANIVGIILGIVCFEIATRLKRR
jgi:VanZ family protein